MVLGSELDMLPNELVQTTVEGGRRGGSNGNFESSLASELQLMLQEQRSRGNWGERERDLNMYRSGSAPPTVEGSLTAVGSLFGKSNFSEFNSSSGGTGSATNGVFSEEDNIRSHPAYLSYYYSHENVNPRLPPPLLSKEDWRVTQRFQEGGGSLVGRIGDWRRKNLVDDGDNSSLFSMPPRLPLQRRENEFPDPSKATPTPSSLMQQTSAEWHERGPNCFVGLPAAGLGARRKSFADILQARLSPPSSLAGQLSRPSSHKAVCETRNGTCFSESHLEDLCNERESMDAFHSRATATDRFRVQGHAAGSSFSRSTTPEAQIVGGTSSTGLPPVGGRNAHNGFPSSAPKLDDVEATLSGLSLSGNNLLAEDNHIQSQLQQRFGTQTNFFFSMPSVHNQSLQQQFINNSRVEKLGLPTDFSDLGKKKGLVTEQNNSKTSLDGPANFPRRALSSDNLYSGMNSSGFGGFEGSNLQNKNIPNMDGSGHVHSGYFFNNKLSSVGRCHLDTVLSGGGDGRGSNRSKGHIGVDLHSSVMDCTQYSQRSSGYEPRATANLGNPSPAARNYFCTSQRDLVGLQNEYYGTLLAQQKHQYELLQLSRSGGMNDRYYPNISCNRDKQFQNVSPNSSDAPGGLMFQNGRSSHFTSTGRNSVEGFVGPWNPDFISNVDGRIASSLLEEFKSNKTKSFELSDIVDHLVEFSRDQFGSRFIQQKLETATIEEKNKIFPEIVPHARTLMTDVFGNYVIQKFFEHGRDSEIMDLASQLSGHVLPLSLQMYGCRVIQKALEVVDVDQQTLMVSELDGSVMKCVRDQNGNHVIQKSIECVPQDRIQFIISAFYGQVVSLSTHPYGCRVIQRVLEHCCDLNAQQIIMDEIMQSVCNLAQDQYGNYVIQHILQHGKADERTAIISKLAGQIVKMSQQKFASNVVEKCLTFGGPEERQLLVTEMLGYSDDNEPLQAMMKDPFGNYVVQKVLETYNDQSRELILSRIKVHLNTLKKYTYGKHIVSRVEKLITTGERHMAMSSSFSS